MTGGEGVGGWVGGPICLYWENPGVGGGGDRNSCFQTEPIWEFYLFIDGENNKVWEKVHFSIITAMCLKSEFMVHPSDNLLPPDVFF